MGISKIDFVRISAYNNYGLFYHVSDVNGGSMEYSSIRQTAEKWGITVRRVQVLCAGNRIPGAVRIGYSWAIPSDAKKPSDARIKSGRYIKSN